MSHPHVGDKPKGRGTPRPEKPNYPVAPEHQCCMCGWPKAKDEPDYCKQHMFQYRAALKQLWRDKNPAAI